MISKIIPKLERLERIEIDYGSATEFRNPFFVIVHAKSVRECQECAQLFELNPLDPDLLDKVESEISTIKEQYDFVETSRFVFAQSSYFSLRVRKSNLDGAQEPEHAPDFSPRVLDMNKWPPQLIPRGVPRDRPILVCGFFEGQCVRDQYESLKLNGYNAYISREGTF